jgi:hypothetical protein
VTIVPAREIVFDKITKERLSEKITALLDAAQKERRGGEKTI